jgi:hypothetical protein
LTPVQVPGVRPPDVLHKDSAAVQALPYTLEEPEDLKQDSSKEDSRPVEVVENVRLASAGSGANVRRRLSLRLPHSRDVSGSNTTSSGTGTRTGSFTQPPSTTLAPPHRSASLSVVSSSGDDNKTS